MKNLLLFIVLCVTLFSCVKPNELERPNILFIMCDDLNDYEGYFGGHPQAYTPNIDRLAAEGVQFFNAHTNAPVCSPSRNSLFTGVYPFKSQDYEWLAHFKHPVLKNNKTIMELLNENDYYTLGSGKLLHHNKREFWDEWGVDERINYGPYAFDGDNQVAHTSVPEPYRSIGPTDGGYGPISAPLNFSEREDGKRTGWMYSTWSGKWYNIVDEDNRDPLPDEMHATWAVQKFKDLAARDNEDPFFMGVGFVRPHTPLYAPKRFFDMFPIDELQLPTYSENDNDDTHYNNLFDDFAKGRRFYSRLVESYGGDAELGMKHFLQAYLACVAFADEQVGHVLDALENSPYKDNTIVIFTADHGWQMGEKNYLYKNSPWENSTKVPMVIKYPGVTKGEKVHHPVSLIDLFPTFVDFCGLEGDNTKGEDGLAIDGTSLKPFVFKPNTKKWQGDKGAVTMLGTDGREYTLAPDRTYTLRTTDWRYIRYHDGSEELYNHKDDPYEWHNLADQEEWQELKGQMKADMFEIINN